MLKSVQLQEKTSYWSGVGASYETNRRFKFSEKNK